MSVRPAACGRLEWRGSGAIHRALAVALTLAAATTSAATESSQPTLTLSRARERARATSPRLAVAREAANAARGEERQAAAIPNPLIGYDREQTFGDGDTVEEDLAFIEQPLEIGGQRGLRREAARRQRLAAEAALRAEQRELDFAVTQAFALALAADERAAQAARAAEAFSRAHDTSLQRRSEGDVSGYDHRRIALEAARYAALSAHAAMERRAARLALAEHVETSEQMSSLLAVSLEAPADAGAPRRSLDELRGLALESHPRLFAAEQEGEAAGLLAELAGRAWVPTPVLSVGYKRERFEGITLNGYIAGLALPLPIWDRKGGERAAAEARARGQRASVRVLRRAVAREVEGAWAAYAAAAARVEALRPHLGDEARAAVEAARASYDEGEIRLLEWLDAVRAYYEAASAFAIVRADVLVQRAALERAVGAPLD